MSDETQSVENEEQSGSSSEAIRLNSQNSGRTKTTHAHWFRGKHTHFNPSEDKMVSHTSVPEFVLKGWEPPEKIIKPDTQVTAFGSCFASNISDWLSHRNFRVLNKAEDAKRAYVVTFGEGMVNSFVIRQQFEWAWENKVFDQPLWHGYKAEEFGYDPEIQAETKRIFDETEVFILTFGLSEVWYDEPTGNVFWRTVPKDAYDPSRHKFRVSTVEENRDNLEAIYQLIRKHRPDAKIVFTLSPIPLIATFRDNSCLTSNSVSKAVLRVSIDEVVREHKDEGHLFYWPSHEIVADVFHLPYKSDRRHPHQRIIRYIMTLFEHTWCESPEDNPAPPLQEAWIRACSVAGLLPEEIDMIVARRQKVRLRRFIKNSPPMDPDPELDKAKRDYLRTLLQTWHEEDTAAAAAIQAAE